ncbi:MAG: hypothetical protein ACXAAK_13035, partial [Candidatus Thorarchaeota archaeon]
MGKSLFQKYRNIIFVILVSVLVSAPAIFVMAQTTWHDDCTSTSGWNSSDDWDGWTKYTTEAGTLSTTGGYLHTGAGTADDQGPFWYKDLGASSYLNSFEELNIELEAIQDTITRTGSFCVALFDSDKEVVMYIEVRDSFTLGRSFIARAAYVYSNGTTIENLSPTIANSTISTQIQILIGSNGALSSVLPDSSETALLSSNNVDDQENREIRYIGIQWSKPTSDDLDIRLHDILYIGGGSVITPPPPPPPVSLETLFAIGIILAGIIAVAIIRIKAKEFSRRYFWVYSPIIFLYVGVIAIQLLIGSVSFDDPVATLQQMGLYLGVTTVFIA